MGNREKTHNNKQNQVIIYAAQDIARILVRNPEELTDLLTYDYMCENFGKGIAFEDLPPPERQALLSVEAAIDELEWLGFRPDQINVFLTALKDGMKATGFAQIKPDIGIISMRERFEMAVFSILTFPHGPSLLHTTPDYPMKSKGMSMHMSSSVMGSLTNHVANLIFNERTLNPQLLCVPYQPEIQERLDSGIMTQDPHR